MSQAVNLNQIPCVFKIAVSKNAFIAAMKVGLHEEMTAHPDLFPVIHISSHGDDAGIQLSNKEVVSWKELSELLKPINTALGGSLLLCMSSCQGFSARRMAVFTKKEEVPFFAVVGNNAKPTWPETAIAYATFYHLISNGEYVINAVTAMKTASGNNDFFMTTAEAERRQFWDLVRKISLRNAQQQLQQQAQSPSPGNLSKMVSITKK